MLRTLLLLSLGTFLTSGWKLISVPLEKQGCSNSQKNLVCAEQSGNYQIFMNQCYFQNASKTNMYNLTDPNNCNNFKDYVYVEYPTCAEVIQKANKQKLVHTQSYYSLIEVIENDFERYLKIPESYYSVIDSTIRYYKQQIYLLNKLKNSLNTESNEENRLTWPSNCGYCTEDYSDTYEICLDKELQSFIEEEIKLEEEWTLLKSKYLDIREGRLHTEGLHVIVRKITSVQAEEYLVNSIENLNKKYSKEMDILRNSTIPNDVYATGKIIIDYFRICRDNIGNKFVIDSIDRLIYAVEGLIQPFDSFRYTNLEPLMAFLTIKENTFYENMLTVSGYEYVFTGHNNYFTVLKDTNSISLAILAWYKTILSDFGIVGDFLGYDNGYGVIVNELIYCVTNVASDFKTETPVNFSNFQNMVSSCFSDYQMLNVCLDKHYGSVTSNLQNNTGYKNKCIRLNIGLYNKEVIECCF